MEGSQPHVDAARLRRSMDRLYGICAAIAEKADDVVLTRCPYKDADDRCTAAFGCRNQQDTGGAAARPLCIGSDQLNYRSAWDI